MEKSQEVNYETGVKMGDNLFLNLTPHAINLNDGTVFPPSGYILRIPSVFETVRENMYVVRYKTPDMALKEVHEGARVCYIVSAMLMAHAPKDLVFVAPATGHPDTVRNEKGHIVSVPGFVLNK